MPGDALWALVACLMIEAIFGPIARIVRMWRHPQRTSDPEPGGTDAAKQKGGGS